jgi:tRNA A37 threonylcarbamoyladenosine modification protein TsaB
MDLSLHSLPRPLTWIDASTGQVDVAVSLSPGDWKSRSSQQPATEGIFDLLRQCLNDCDLTLSMVRCFLWNRGPGSSLGLRTCAMTLRAWQSLPAKEERLCLGVLSTAVLANTLQSLEPGRPVQIAIPVGRLSWLVHGFDDQGSPTEPWPRAIPLNQATELGPRVHTLAGLKVWQDLPPHFSSSASQLRCTLEALDQGRLPLVPTPEPTPFPETAPEFLKWSPASRETPRP